MYFNKCFKLILFLCSFGSLAQETVPDFAVNFRPYFNPTFYKAQESDLLSNKYEYVGIKGFDLRLDYHFAKVLDVGLGIGYHGFDLRVFNNGIWQWIKNEENIEDVDYFGQKGHYLVVPMEFGLAPRLGKGGWFEPRFIVGVTPHFRLQKELTVEFNDSTTWSDSQLNSVRDNFEGGARETYTTLDITTEFKFWPGKYKRSGCGISFGYSHHLTGPQTFILKNGFGLRAGFTVSRRF